ncbi:hypothetical protein EB796_010513 [Bugula neritina]|uniref:Uncharacterized protein n=1 Tax=Bugula neritina TaxID=10212 RepID=A0A7J7JZ53_BUGNE|nr:hypothetical protein EB796_010513 [Bugula neritina]
MKEQHNQQLTLLRSQHEAHIANAEHAQSLIIDNMKQEAQTDIQSKKDAMEQDYMKQLSELGVDLNVYLKTKQPQPCSQLIVLS